MCWILQQSQLDDKDRTIKIQHDLIQKLEAEKDQVKIGMNELAYAEQAIETVNSATQTDRVNRSGLVFSS